MRVYAVAKEHPYTADGIPRDVSQRAEFYLTAPLCDKNYTLSFYVNGEEYGGEFSFDNVKSEYYFFCTADLSAIQSIRCIIGDGETQSEVNALSVLTGEELSARDILNHVQTENAELFISLTDQYGFAGEIYIRLIHEENNYYYLGIIERTGKIHAFLLNASTGKILAKRETN